MTTSPSYCRVSILGWGADCDPHKTFKCVFVSKLYLVADMTTFSFMSFRDSYFYIGDLALTMKKSIQKGAAWEAQESVLW